VRKRLVGVNRICQICGISKTTYYQAKNPQESFLAKYVKIKKYVEKIIDRHSSYGIRRIKAALWQDYQIAVGRDVLGKPLVLWGLNLKRKIRKKKISLIQKILIWLSDKVNLLIRTKITEPMQAITSDISIIRYASGKKAYLCVHKDIFGQLVYGHSIQETMENKLAIESFRKAEKNIKKWLKKKKLRWRKILFHQDQGSQYTSYQYVEEVLKFGTLSYSTPGTPTDNPGQESFSDALKMSGLMR
jgi:transposase InsO family protein